MARSEVVLATGRDGTRVALHIPSATYLKLHGAAGEILELLLSSGDPTLAAVDLSRRHALSEDQARADVDSVLEEFGRLRRQRSRVCRRPTLRGVGREARTWWRLPLRFRIEALRTVCVLVVVEIGLRASDLGSLARFLRVPLATDLSASAAPTAEGAALSVQERTGFISLEWVLRRWPFGDTCLRRGLVAGFFLRRRTPVLRLGLMRDGVTSHAWVEAEGCSYGASEQLGGIFAARTGVPAP